LGEAAILADKFRGTVRENGVERELLNEPQLPQFVRHYLELGSGEDRTRAVRDANGRTIKEYGSDPEKEGDGSKKKDMDVGQRDGL
jgi:hypothetical protein